MSKTTKFNINKAFEIKNKKLINRYVDYIMYLKTEFNIEFNNNTKKNDPRHKTMIPGFVIPQDQWFKLLDLTMLQVLWVEAGDWDAPPIIDDEVTDYRPLIQDVHVDLVLDTVLWSVGHTDEEFEKPYDLSDKNNDLIFHYKQKNIFERLLICYEDYIDIINNNVKNPGRKYV